MSIWEDYIFRALLASRGTAGPCSGGEMGGACVCVLRAVDLHSFLPSPGAHTRGAPPPSSVHIDFVSVSLYCNFISVVSADGGPAEGGAFVYWL